MFITFQLEEGWEDEIIQVIDKIFDPQIHKIQVQSNIFQSYIFMFETI